MSIIRRTWSGGSGFWKFDLEMAPNHGLLQRRYSAVEFFRFQIEIKALKNLKRMASRCPFERGNSSLYITRLLHAQSLSHFDSICP